MEEPHSSPEDQTQSASEEHRLRMIALDAEQTAKVKERDIRRGVLIVNDGGGKGKSTAAFGMAIRAAGHGQRVGLIQFIKGTWKTGEQAAIRRFPEIDHVVSGEGFTWKTQDRQRDIEAARRGWTIAQEMIEASRGPDPKYQVLILDELNIALRYDYLDLAEVVAVLGDRPQELSIMVTGRDAKPELVAIADTVTHMTCVKHAFNQNVRARKGVDF
jgi:cob(I)alamin adenosyltransferase